ncbi:hypothetical protein DRW03_18775 [Corallococcus sp. H22C18031201]|nr:hypothetical protein DRW03_18775 [Corallococcus sp. H22C18031201]
MLERSFLFRLLAAVALSAPCACATPSASSAELVALQAEVHTLRDTQARLQERLQRLEDRDAVSRAPRAAAPVSASSAPPAAGENSSLNLPPSELAVVRLKPRNDPAPRIPTAVSVVEPDTDQMEMFISPVDESSAASVTPVRESGLPERDPAVLDAEYEHSVSLLRTGNVEGGVERLARFAAENPRHPRADNALYFSGLGQVGLKDYAAAAKTFERLIETYPAGDAMLDGMLRLAECRVRLNQAAQARALYTRVVTQFPGTAAATQAEQRLAALSP